MPAGGVKLASRSPFAPKRMRSSGAAGELSLASSSVAGNDAATINLPSGSTAKLSTAAPGGSAGWKLPSRLPSAFNRANPPSEASE